MTHPVVRRDYPPGTPATPPGPGRGSTGRVADVHPRRHGSDVL
ncbi:hypothetical protein ACFPM0_04870 [Pseudonocardia sulfidoxydans]